MIQRTLLLLLTLACLGGCTSNSINYNVAAESEAGVSHKAKQAFYVDPAGESQDRDYLEVKKMESTWYDALKAEKWRPVGSAGLSDVIFSIDYRATDQVHIELRGQSQEKEPLWIATVTSRGQPPDPAALAALAFPDLAKKYGKDGMWKGGGAPKRSGTKTALAMLVGAAAVVGIIAASQ